MRLIEANMFCSAQKRSEGLTIDRQMTETMSDWKLRKICNAFIWNATPSSALQGHALNVANHMEKVMGGLWVGGSVTATPQGILFSANAMNRALHDGLEDIFVASSDIQSITQRFGWVSGIVVVAHDLGEFRFRCFGAKRFATELAKRFKV